MDESLLKNPDLARVVADVTTDGHLQIQDWRYLVSFYSNNIEDIKGFEYRVFRLFNLPCRVYIDYRQNTKYRIFLISKPVSLFLRDIGTLVGNKTNIPFEIPLWVRHGSNAVMSAYLQGLFDGEGSIHETRGKNNAPSRWRISFAMCKNENILDSGFLFMEQIRSLLLEFGIVSSPIRKRFMNKRKDGSLSYELVFTIEKSSFRNFYKFVGFLHPQKREKLYSALALKRGFDIFTDTP